jgi:hypothetical protein
MRRALTALLCLAVLSLLATAAAGCGSSTSAKNGTDEAFGYFPKDSLLVVAIKTDLSDAQYKQVNALVDKFPFAGTVKERFKAGINSGSNGRFDFDKDVKPALGNDVVIGIPSAAVANAPSHNNFVVAWKTKNGDAKKLLAPGARKVGSSNGATVYSTSRGGFDAVKGGVALSAPTRATLDVALKQRNAGNRMTQAQFDSNLGGLRKDALVRAEGNIQKLLATDPKSAMARKVPWVNALRTFSATTATDPDGVAIDFNVKTQGTLKAAQLPLAAGSAAPPVVKRPGEIASALRNPGQIAKFFEQAAYASQPKSTAEKAKLEKALGVNIDRDLIGQLGGNSASSFALDGGFAMRADLKNPAAFQKTLATALKNLPKARKVAGGHRDHPAPTVRSIGGGFYAITDATTGRPRFLGVVGKQVVLASDMNRAKEFAVQPASPAAGTKGSFALSADPKSIADAIIKKKATGASAILGTTLTGPLKDLTGWVDSETGGLRGHFKLTIR